MNWINPTGGYDPKYNGSGISIVGRSCKYPHDIVVAKNLVRDWAYPANEICLLKKMFLPHKHYQYLCG